MTDGTENVLGVSNRCLFEKRAIGFGRREDVNFIFFGARFGDFNFSESLDRTYHNLG